MGLGQRPVKRYRIRFIKHKFGALDKCIDYMKANPPKRHLHQDEYDAICMYYLMISKDK